MDYELQARRKARINQIIASLKKSVEEGVEIDNEKLTNQCCYEWGLARRTVMEYITIARSQVDGIAA